MDVFPFFIKIKQTNQTESLKVKGNSRTISPPLTSFNQIFHNIHKSTNSSEQKKMGNPKNITNQENNIKNIDKMDSVKLKLSAVIASLTTRIQETQKQQDPNFGVLPTDQDSQFQLTDASISHNSIQQEAGDSSIDLSLFLTVLKDMEKGEAIEKTELLKQTLDLIKKLPIEEKQKWLEAIEFTNFQGITQGQPLKELILNFSEGFPEYKIGENLKFTEEHGTSRNQTSLAIFIDEQSDLVSRAIIKKNGSQPPPVFPVSQLVPVISEMIGEFLTTIPEQNGSGEAKISLQPEELGPVQIIITSEQGKVTLQIVTKTISGKNTIENQSHNLKQTLQQQGIFIQKIEINHQPPMEEQSFISPVISMENQTPLTKVVESQPAFNTSEILANQQMHQPEKPNEINIKSKEPQSVIQVSQFVPEVSEWIGELVKAIPIPEQSSLTEAKISLQPEQLGPIQIKVTNENRKVTVHIFTETISGKEALDNQLLNLKQTLQQQGVFVEKIEISHQPPVEEQSFMTSVVNKENPAPIRNGAESQPAFKTTEILANQQIHQPDKINKLNIKSKEPQSVIQVSQFVPEVSERIGELVKAIPEQQSSLTEAKISLQPDHFGPIQIKVTNENRKVTAKIVTDTILAKDTIEVQLPQLRQALQQQGIPAGKIEISHQPQMEDRTIVSSVINKENPAPIRNAVEPKPTFKVSEILAKQQMHQPEKINELNIKSKEPPSVVHVSQFIPEVSEWIGELVKAIPQQSSTTEAKISLQPDHLGPIQIKVTYENRKVTAKIVTDTIFAKDTIEVQLPQLRQALQQQGVLVQKLEITHQPLLVKDLIQAINTPLSNQGFFTSSIGAREKPVPTTKTLEKQNIMTSWGSKGKQVILQKTVEEQKIPTARGSGENQTSFPITVEEQITITTQEKGIDQTHWSKSEEVPMTSEERSNHARPQPPVEEQSNISKMPSVEQQTPLKKAFEEPRILPSMNTRGDPIFDSNLEIKSSNFMPEEYKEEQIPVTNHTEEQQTFDSSEKIVIQQMQQPDKLIAAKPIAPQPVFPVSQFVPEISKWIQGVIRTNPEQFGSTEAKFSLNPEKLGPIQIKITTEQGKVTAQIVTDTIFAKEALELQLPQLRQALQQQGILVQKLEIIQQNLQYADFAQSNNSFSQGSSGFSQDQRANTSSQNGPKKQKESNKEEIVKEMVFTTYGGRGPRSTQSNIDFTA